MTEAQVLRRALTLARAFVDEERTVRLNSYAVDGRYESMTDLERSFVVEADECLAAIDAALQLVKQ